MRQRAIGPLLVVAALAGLPSVAGGKDVPRSSVGFRTVLALGDGEPANDIPGAGVFGRYRFGDRWAVSAALEGAEYDFEQPARLLGLEQDPAVDVIDSKAQSLRASVWVERALGPLGGPSRWYVGLGLGVADVDAPDVTGPLRGGGAFDIRTEVDPEVIVSAVGGWERDLGRRWLLDFALRWEQHFADWQVEDTISGRRAAVGDYNTYGAHLGIGWRF